MSRSHDHRALPEIPALSQASVSQTEDEEEEDGLYDVIAKSRQRQASGGSRATPNVTPVRKPGNNLYEKVDDVNPKGATANLDNSPLKNPYAVVDGIGHADYAHIDEKKGTPDNKDIKRVQTLGLAPQASVETLDDTSYSSVSGPPVPEKNFDLNDESLTISSTPASSNSPSLPPRNGTHSVVLSDGLVSVIPGTSSIVTNQNGASIVTVTQDAAGVSNGSSGEESFIDLHENQKYINVKFCTKKSDILVCISIALLKDACKDHDNHNMLGST